MTDLQKDKAIYQALCKIAEKYFNRAIECNGDFRKYMAEKNIILAKELDKCQQWKQAVSGYIIVNGTIQNIPAITWDDEKITVGTFQCEFPGDLVFDIMKQFKTLAKEKEDYFFTYEEELTNEFVGSVDITFDNPANAKFLAKHVSKEERFPILQHVLVEMNAMTGDINFVATDSHLLGVISNNAESISTVPEDESKVYSALFKKSDWERICDYARKAKSAVTFEVYRRNQVLIEDTNEIETENQDTMVAVLGDLRVKSVVLDHAYPNWRRVLQRNADKHFVIHPDDVKSAQKFIQGIKFSGDSLYKERQHIFVSFYRGSDIAYFDYFDEVYGTSQTTSFRLTEPAQQTIGTCYNIQNLQKIKFTGFRLEDTLRPTIIDCEEADLMLVMPVIAESECVFHANEREMTMQLTDVA